MTLFHKAVIFTDSHFGRSGDSAIANQDNLDFIDWMLDRARSWGAETCIFLGDYFHNRAAIGISSLAAGLSGLEKISAAGFKQTIFLVGNHDIARRASRDISSLNIAAHFPSLHLVRDPLTIGDVTFLPWMVGHEQDMLPSLSSRYVFAHLETVGAMMNARVACTGGEHAVDADSLRGIDLCFTGHFHQRQTIRNVCYTGSIMPFDFSDADDADRGITLLKWGSDPIFEAWPDQPLFHRTQLSTLLNNLEKLRPKMTVRASVDFDLQRQEIQEIRRTLTDGYGLRRIELPEIDETVEVTEGTKSVLQSVEQIVIDGLDSVESKEFSCQRLKDIFLALPRR